MNRGPRRSRRRTRAIALGITVDELESRTPKVAGVISPIAIPPVTPMPAPPPAPGCCTVTRIRQLSLGGSVVVLHRHEGRCPVWSAR